MSAFVSRLCYEYVTCCGTSRRCESSAFYLYLLTLRRSHSLLALNGPGRPNYGNGLMSPPSSGEDAISVIHTFFTLSFFPLPNSGSSVVRVRGFFSWLYPRSFILPQFALQVHGACHWPHLPFIPTPPCLCVLLPSSRSFYRPSLSPRTVASTVPPVARQQRVILAILRRASSRNATAPAQAHLVGSAL